MKLFVGNLSYDTTEPELREFFAEFEPIVELSRPLDRETGQPRGFAFVTLMDREMGEKAIAELDGKDLGGRQVRIDEAEDRGSRPPRRPISFENDVTEGNTRPVDDRPTDSDGNKVTYKSI